MTDTTPEEALAMAVVLRGRRAVVDMWYPRCADGGARVAEVEVGLMDVRAADSILIQYDFERDGYSIKQASTFQLEGDDKVCDPDWQEVAFVKSWARDTTPREP